MYAVKSFVLTYANMRAVLAHITAFMLKTIM